MRGSSFMQERQDVAQKFTSTTLPRRSEMANFSPDSAENVTCGATAACLLQAPAATRVAARHTTLTATKRGSRMRIAIVAALALAAIACAAPALAQLERFTDKEAGAGMKAALEKGAREAVA